MDIDRPDRLMVIGKQFNNDGLTQYEALLRYDSFLIGCNAVPFCLVLVLRSLDKGIPKASTHVQELKAVLYKTKTRYDRALTEGPIPMSWT